MTRDTNRDCGDGLVTYFALAFAITWGLALLFLLFPGPLTALFGPVSAANPLFILAVAAPTIAATCVTLARAGPSGLRALSAHLIRWHFGLRWYAAILVGIPLVAWLLAAATGSHGTHDLSTPARVLAFLLLQLILGPLGEELGWRGFALPRLLQRFAPLAASLILGIIWGVWHLPSFLLSGTPQAGLSLPVFLLFALCLAILATWIFLHTGESVLAVVLFHFAVNATMSAFGVPLAAATVAAATTAVLVVVADRRLGWFKTGRGAGRLYPSPATLP